MLKQVKAKKITVRGGHFAIVASKYNARYVDAMLRAAKAADEAGFAARRVASEAKGLRRGLGLSCHLHGTGGIADDERADAHELTLAADQRGPAPSGMRWRGEQRRVRVVPDGDEDAVHREIVKRAGHVFGLDAWAENLTFVKQRPAPRPLVA